MGRYRVQIVTVLLAASLIACTKREPNSPEDSWMVTAHWNNATQSWEQVESNCFIIIDPPKFSSAPDCERLPGFPEHGNTLSMNTQKKTFVVIDEIIEHRAVARARYDVDGDTLTVNMARASRSDNSYEPPRDIVPEMRMLEEGWKFKRMN